MKYTKKEQENIKIILLSILKQNPSLTNREMVGVLGKHGFEIGQSLNMSLINQLVDEKRLKKEVDPNQIMRCVYTVLNKG